MSQTDAFDWLIWVIEDHPLYKDALAMLLQTRLSARVHAHDSVPSALESAAGGSPHLVVVDFNLSGPVTGVKALLTLTETLPSSVRILSHSAVEDPQSVQMAIQAGAQAFISKAVHPDRLVEQIHRLLHRMDPIPYWIRGDEGLSTPAPADWVFTDRQRDIIRLMLQGKPNKTIASELDLAEITVKQHLSRIFEKLGVNSRAQAIAKLHA